MPVYTYKALKDDGAAEQGVIDADSPKDARIKLLTHICGGPCGNPEYACTCDE